MSITSAFFSGLSGLDTHGNAIQVVASNLANLNTVGFKSSDQLFSDIYTGMSSRLQVGSGSSVEDIRMNLTQGGFQSTGNVLDMAIDGEGYFIVQDTLGPAGATTKVSYTRAGTFDRNKDGQIVNPDGLFLQGKAITLDTGGNTVLGSRQEINLKTLTVGGKTLNVEEMIPSKTTTASIVANLDSQTTVNPALFTPLDPYATSEFNTAVTVYDSEGVSHLVRVFFKRTAIPTTTSPVSKWEWHVVVDAVDSGQANASEGANGTLTFTPEGVLQADTVGVNAFGFVGAVQGQTIAMNFGANTNNGGSGLDGITQFGSPSVVLSQTQDGFSSGILTSISIDGKGVLSGLYSNGKTNSIAQIELAKFVNPGGLFHKGNNLFVESTESGVANVNTPTEAGNGSVVSNNLEISNVDAAEEFVKLIQYQRGFQANTRVITTGDEMLQDIIGLKR